MAFPKINSESMSAETLTEYFKVLAGGDEGSQGLLVQGMKGLGIAKVEGPGEGLGVKELVELTGDTLVGLLQSSDEEDKSLGTSLAWEYYQGARSAKNAAAKNNAAE
jgi:hypothetical protein